MILFDMAAGDTVAINASLVTHVGRNHIHDDQCLIYFGEKHVSVLGSVQAVAERLRSAGLRE